MTLNPPGKPDVTPGPPFVTYHEPMVNYAETLLPEQSRRSLARGIVRPELLERVHDSRPQAQCPSCTAWRPAMCISLTSAGWSCDGCISGARRRGTFVEW